MKRPQIRGQMVMLLKLFSRSGILLFFVPLLFAGCSCSFASYRFNQAQQAAEDGRVAEAVSDYEKIFTRDPNSELGLKSLRQAARLADYELKNFQKALQLYEQLLLLSPDPDERIQVQKTIADVYFDKLNDYKSSVRKYNELLTLALPPEMQVEARLRIAKSHYYLSEFYQAETEAKRLLNMATTDEQKFEIELFTANIFFNTERVDLALNKYRSLLKTFPKQARRENVEMTIVVALEEVQEFDKAIEMLEEMKAYYPETDFLDLKIKSLRHRRANMPGSKGLRK